MDVINNIEPEKLKFLKEKSSIPDYWEVEKMGLFQGKLKKLFNRKYNDYKITEIKLFTENGEFGNILEKYDKKGRNEEIYINSAKYKKNLE